MVAGRGERKGWRCGDWRPDRRFLSLAGLEFCERFAMAGIKSLLLLALVDHVFAGDLTRVSGASSFRAGADALFGPLSVTGLASELYGCANALIYVAIPIGGLLGDLVTGRRATILAGGAAMLAGMLLMLGSAGFLVGLLLFAVGTGAVKGNLSAQVGALFTDEAQRRAGYSWYLVFLNVGVFCGPLVCGTLAALLGWAWAVGAAMAVLIVGLACYGGATRHPIGVRTATAARHDGARARSVAGGWRRMTLLLVALIAIYLCYSPYEQLSALFLLWARTRIALDVAGWPIPVSWFLSLDGLITLVLLSATQAAFGALDRRGIRIGAMTQIVLGGLFCAAGYLVLALACHASGPVPLAVALLYLLLIDGAVVMIWPSGLSLIAQVAPRRFTGFWMGLFYLHGFFASLWVGMSGAFYGRIPPASFWLLHAGVAGLGAAVALVAGLPLMRCVRSDQAITTSACAKARA